MADINVRFDIRFSARTLRLAMIGAMVLAAAPELASESVSLTTYYPAPSGVYAQLISTNNTWLARDGGYLDVGTSVVPGAGTEMAVMGGRVGIGLTAPANELQVKGLGAANVDLAVNGRMQTGDASNLGGVWLNSGNTQFIGQESGTALGIYNAGAWDVTVLNNGNVGVGTLGPANKLQVVGAGGGNIDFAVTGRMQTGDAGGAGGVWLDSTDTMFVGQAGANPGIWTAGAGWALQVTQAGIVDATTVGAFGQACGEITWAANAAAPCAGYVTEISGVYTQYYVLENPITGAGGMNTDYATVNALCCAIPGGAPLY